MLSALVILGLLTSSSTSPTPSTTSISVQSSDTYTQVDTYQIELTADAAPIQITWQDPPSRLRSTWGASYANSTENMQLVYVGYALAAGNVYQNLRIVQVCIWYTRDGALVSSRVCSSASSDLGYWVSGSEVSTWALDSLDWNAPKTIFNIQTTRVSPLIA